MLPILSFFTRPTEPTLWWGGSLLSFAILLLLLVAYFRIVLKNKQASIRLRNLLIGVAAAGGFIVYWIGYNDEGTASSLLAITLRSFLSTFEMFFFHSDLIEVRSTMKDDPVYMTFFSFFHFLPFLIGFMILIQLFGRHFLSWLRLKGVRGGKTYLFFGLNEPTASLTASLAAKKAPGSRIICLDKKIEKREEAASESKLPYTAFRDRGSLFDRISKFDAWLLRREYTAEVTFRQLGLAPILAQGNAHMFFFTDHTSYNLQSALKAIDELQNTIRPVAPVTLYVCAHSDYLINLFEGKSTDRIDVQIVNPAKLAVMELLTNHPPVDYIAADTRLAVAGKDFNVMLIGFGKVGSYALRMLTEHGQFVGSTFHATVIDRQMNVKQGEFQSRFPGMRRYAIDYHPVGVDSSEYWKLITEQMDTLDYVVISLGDTELNMQTAIRLHRFLERKADRKISIFVKVHHNSDYGYMEVFTHRYSRICIFGGNDTIFTEDIIINEMRILRAKKIHEYYNKKQPKEKQVAWKDLSHRKVITNISASLHLETKLKLAGLSPEDLKKYPCEAEFENELGKERLENLAKGEHLHWNATLFTNEWDTLPLSDATGNMQFDEKRKLHACLVDWDALEAVEKRFGCPFRSFDYDTVKGMYQLVKEGLLV